MIPIDLTTSLYLILFSIISYLLVKQIKFIRAVHRVPGIWGPLRIQLFGVAWEFLGKTEAQRLRLLQGYAETFPKVGKVLLKTFEKIFITQGLKRINSIWLRFGLGICW